MLPKHGIEVFLLVLLLSISLGGEISLLLKGQRSEGDPAFHLTLVDGLLEGKYPRGTYPYPPAFHATNALLSVVLLTSPLQIMTTLKLILFPLAVLSTTYLVMRRAGLYPATLCALLLASSPAFWDRASQVTPQAIDVILLPLAVYFFLEDRRWAFVATGTYLVYNHLAYPLLPLSGLLVYSFLHRGRTEEFAKIAALSLPLFLFMGLHLSAIHIESASIQTLQEKAVLSEPLFAIKYLGYPLFFLIPLVGIHKRFKGFSEIEIIALFWALFLLPMAVYFPDRLIEYAAQPLAILGAITLDELVRGKKSRLTLLIALGLFSMVSLAALYGALIRGGIVLLPLDTLSPFAI